MTTKIYVTHLDLYKVKYWDDAIGKYHHLNVVAYDFERAVEIAKEFIGDGCNIDAIKFIDTTTIVQND